MKNAGNGHEQLNYKMLVYFFYKKKFQMTSVLYCFLMFPRHTVHFSLSVPHVHVETTKTQQN